MNYKYNFQVLIASLNGNKDIYIESNLKCHCIIANQTDNVSYYSDDNLIMINTNTIGVGKNRNISLLYSNAKYILFGDDDVKYVDDLENIILDNFKKLKKADVLIFNIETKGNSSFKRRKNKKIKRVRWYNYMNYGAARIACKKESISKSNIWFTELFGGGAPYSCGEDVMFLSDCLKKQLKIYTIPICIGTVDQTTSTWFKGYNDKLYEDKGALLKSIYPHLYKLFLLYFSFKQRTKERSFIKNYKDGLKGARLWKKI